jgi:hypothetical protein
MDSGNQAMTKKAPAGQDRRWSGQVTRHSNALDLEPGVFTWDDPAKIARSLKRSADQSARRKSPPFRSAMSMLVFYINRAGKNLDDEQLRILERAKEELRILYGKNTL